jgi:hypothetical protein
MTKKTPTLEYETSEFIEANRRWLLWPMIATFATGCAGGLVGILVLMDVAGVNKTRLSVLIVAGFSFGLGVALAAAFGREPKRRRIVRPSETVMMIRCRDCGQLTPHTVRRSSEGQCTVECTECAAGPGE